MKLQRRTSSGFHVHFSPSPGSISRGASPSPSSRRGKPTASLRVVIVDDDSSTQQTMLKRPAQKARPLLFETYRDYQSGFDSLKRNPPNTVFFADSINGVSGMDWLRKFKLAIPKVPIVLLSKSISPANVIEAIRCGARGFLMKPVRRRKLLQAIARCRDGWPTFCRQAQDALLVVLRPPTGSSLFRLTIREEQVLNLLFRNSSDKEISSALSVGAGTVHSYLTQIYKKLGAHNRRQAVKTFFRQESSGDKSLSE